MFQTSRQTIPYTNQGLDSERSGTPSARPERFIALCFLYCILLGRNCRDSAKTALAQAFEIFQTLIVEEHREVLACLNLVLTVLFRTRSKRSRRHALGPRQNSSTVASRREQPSSDINKLHDLTSLIDCQELEQQYYNASLSVPGFQGSQRSIRSYLRDDWLSCCLVSGYGSKRSNGGIGAIDDASTGLGESIRGNSTCRRLL